MLHRLLAGCVLWWSWGQLGCSAAQLRNPQLDQEQLDAAFETRIGPEFLERFRELRTRVKRVSHALRAGATSYCGSAVLPDAGLLLGTDESFGAAKLAEVARTAYGLGEKPTVLYVVPGSALASSGVRSGDVLVEVEGRPVEKVATLADRLLEVGGGPVSFVFERGEQPYVVRVEVPRTCAVASNLSPDLGLMTYSVGNTVAVPYGLLDAVPDDDWVAVAMAHQMAHVLIGLAVDPVSDPEATADRLGLLIAHRSGFDASIAPDFWEWLASEDPWRIASTGAFRLARPDPFFPSRRRLYATLDLHVGIAARLPAIRALVEAIQKADSPEAN